MGPNLVRRVVRRRRLVRLLVVVVRVIIFLKLSSRQLLKRRAQLSLWQALGHNPVEFDIQLNHQRLCESHTNRDYSKH